MGRVALHETVALLSEVLGVMAGRGWLSLEDVRREYSDRVGTPPSVWRTRRFLSELARQEVIECRRLGWHVFYRFDGRHMPIA